MGGVWVYNDDGWKIKLTVSDESQTVSSPFEDLYQYQFEAFARCVTEGEEPIVTGIDGLRTNQILAAAYESDRTGRAVSCAVQ